MNYYEYIKKRFRRWAFFYDYTWIPIRYIRKEFYKFSGCVQNKRILDICTGTGSQAIEFTKNNNTVYGIDLSLDMIRVANKKLKNNNLKFLTANATKIPFKNNSFDLISISFGLHEMPLEIIYKAIKDAKRVLKSDGILVIADFKRSDKLLFKLGYPILKWFECDYYPEILKISLTGTLKNYKFIKLNEKEILKGFGRFIKLRFDS
jgi:ubiquinone/menaquinone biosynthesis C-methylase UbiE